MMTASLAPCPSTLSWEQLLADELSAGQRGAMEEHVACCDDCAARLAEMRQQGESYLAGERARALRRTLQVETQKRHRPVMWWFGPLAALAAAGLLAVVWLPRQEPSGASTDGFRAKGAGVLHLHVSRQGRVVELPTAPARVDAGEPVQLAWTAAASGHLLVLLRDSAGGVSTVIPWRGHGTEAVGAGRQQPLGGSLRFDRESPRVELWVFFAAEAFSREGALALARAKKAPATGGALTLTRITVEIR